MIKLALIVFALLALVVLVVVVIGTRLPQAHVIARSVALKQPREAVYALISDLAQAPAWRGEVESVEVMQGDSGETLYREKSRHGVLTYRIDRSDPPQKFVTTIVDKDAPFGGSWIFELADASGGTRLTITERGEVYNPIFRFMAKYVFGHHRTMEVYLARLMRRFGETPLVAEGRPGEK
ncbi:MAG: SRPBCC family protein [Tahibacter sp.]